LVAEPASRGWDERVRARFGGIRSVGKKSLDGNK
jgi:hypothetical protein